MKANQTKLSQPASQQRHAGGRSAEEGHWEEAVRLAELGADLNKTDRVSQTCCNCISVCCCMIVMLTLLLFLWTNMERRFDTFFFGQIWKDGSDDGCLERSAGSLLNRVSLEPILRRHEGVGRGACGQTFGDGLVAGGLEAWLCHRRSRDASVPEPASQPACLGRNLSHHLTFGRAGRGLTPERGTNKPQTVPCCQTSTAAMGRKDIQSLSQ